MYLLRCYEGFPLGKQYLIANNGFTMSLKITEMYLTLCLPKVNEGTLLLDRTVVTKNYLNAMTNMKSHHSHKVSKITVMGNVRIRLS